MSESNWTRDLAAIFDQLDNQQYERLTLLCLNDIPRGVKEGKSREQLVQLVLEHYGLEGSVSIIKEAMDLIPRQDSAVQNLLQPHLERHRGKENQAGNKRPVESASDSEEEEVVQGRKGRKKKRVLSDSEDEDNVQCKQEVEIPPWRRTVADVINCAALEKNKAMLVKLVQKSGIRNYQTKQKETKKFFYVAVSDHTDCLRVMVYGSERYSKMEPGQFYLFREVLMDEGLMKITKNSVVTRTSSVEIPEEIELKAQTLVYLHSPVLSISDIKNALERSFVSVEGTITKIDVLANVKLKGKRRTRKRQCLWISDGSDSIQVCLWGQDVLQLRDKMEGDVVRVVNVRTNCFQERTSLNSTDYTRIIKVSSAPEQNVFIEVIGVQSNNLQIQLEVVLNQEVAPFFIASKVLAKALGVRFGGNFEDRLLKHVPFNARAEIKGSTINAIEIVKPA